MIVYHNSPHIFEKPTIEMIVANRTNHANGLLGLWFSTSNSWQEGFGQYCYEIDIPDDVRIMYMDIDDFVDMCKNKTDFLYIRNELLDNDYAAIYIRELSDKVEMGILLDLDIKVTRIC